MLEVNLLPVLREDSIASLLLFKQTTFSQRAQKKRRTNFKSSHANFAVYQEKRNMYQNKHKAKKGREFSKSTHKERVKQLELKSQADGAR